MLPTLNEEEGLARTIDELPLDRLFLAGFHVRLLVIDGGSSDATVQVARARGATVLSQTGHGKGAAVRQGLAAAVEQGAEFVTVIDADFTYGSDALLPVFSLLAAGSDLAIGVRRPEYDPSETARGLVHRVGDALLTLISARLSRMPFLDICSGLWGVRADALRGTSLESNGFEIEAEVFLKMARRGLHVSQVPVTYRTRIGLAKLRALEDGGRILFSILRYSRWPRAGPTSVDLRYIPAEAPDPRLRPSREWLRAVQSLCFAVSPPRLTIQADRGREPEARELAHALWAGRIRVDLRVSSEDAPVSDRPYRTPADRAPLLRLPELAHSDPDRAVAILQVPKSDALLYVPRYLPLSSRDSRVSRSGAYPPSADRSDPGSLLSLLASTLYNSDQSDSDALLFANARNLGLTAYRPALGGEITSTDEPGRAPAAAQGAEGSEVDTALTRA